MDIQFQTSRNAHHTINLKNAFKAKCVDWGVVTQSYLTDNGTSFCNADFEAKLKAFHQHIVHSSTRAHHSNGLAKQGISIVLSLARVQMHQQAINWSKVSNPAQWPLAVLNTLWIVNHIPQEDTGMSPYEMFTKQKSRDSQLHNLHVWGCPTYALDKKISNGHKLP